MRLRIGDFPVDSDFEPEKNNWIGLKEPSVFVAQLLALPIAILTYFIFNLLIFTTFNVQILIFNVWSIIALICVIPIHELIHAAVFPNFFTSQNTIIGFYPKGLAFYAYYNGEMSKKRFMISLLLPLLSISVLPVIVIINFQIHNSFLLQVIIINALCSCVDILGFLLMLQVPKKAVVRNKGYRTYCKLQEVD